MDLWSATLYLDIFGMCPGGEGAVLKAVASRDVAGSNPVHSVWVINDEYRRNMAGAYRRWINSA